MYFEYNLVEEVSSMKSLIFIVLLGFSLSANVNVVCKAGIMDNKDAKTYIHKLLKKEPKNIECILKLADINLKSGDILKGYQYIARVYKLNPEAMKNSDVADILPFALEMTDMAKKAKKNSDKNLWNQLGNNFFNMGVYNEAINAYEKSLVLDKHQADICLKLAISYKKTDRFYKAVEEFKHVIEQKKETFYANYYLGKIFKYSLNDPKSAKKYLLTAKTILEKQKDSFKEDQYSHYMYDVTTEINKK